MFKKEQKLCHSTTVILIYVQLNFGSSRPTKLPLIDVTIAHCLFQLIGICSWQAAKNIVVTQTLYSVPCMEQNKTLNLVHNG
jgi:hypothetical protein